MYFAKPSTIKVNGGSNNQMSGTIYAPTTEYTFNGGTEFDSVLQTQVIASFIKVDGGAELELNLEGAEFVQTPALIELLK